MLCSIVALSGLLLVGFAPVVWLFSVSSTSSVFIGFMLLALWMICVGFGFNLVFCAGRARHDQYRSLVGLVFYLSTGHCPDDNHAASDRREV